MKNEDKKKILEFLNMTKDLTSYQQAILVDKSLQTIDKWKEDCGYKKEKKPKMFINSKPKKIGIDEPKPVNWENKEWLERMYYKKLYGPVIIARIAGVNHKTVLKRLKEYKFKRRNDKEATKPKHECCNEEWLYYHYATKPEYTEWCEKNDIEPDEYGGQRLSVTKCASLAGVVYQTMCNWLTRYKLRIRGIGEATLGKYGSRYKHKTTAKEKRKRRKKFFEDYRKGKKVIILGTYAFSNGKFLGTRKAVAERGNKNIRGQPGY